MADPDDLFLLQGFILDRRGGGLFHRDESGTVRITVTLHLIGSWSGLHGAHRIGGAYLSAIPGIEFTEMPSARRITHLDRVVQTVALNDPPIGRLSTPAHAAARPRRLRPNLAGVRKAGEPIAPRKRTPDPSLHTSPLPPIFVPL